MGNVLEMCGGQRPKAQSEEETAPLSSNSAPNSSGLLKSEKAQDNAINEDHNEEVTDEVLDQGEKDISNLLAKGIEFYQTGHPAASIPLFEAALEKSRSLYRKALILGGKQGAKKFRNMEGRALGNLASVYEHEGNSERAVSFYKPCLEIMREIGDKEKEAKILNNIGISCLSLDKFEEALDYHQQQLRITTNADAREKVMRRIQLIEDKLRATKND